MHRLLQLALGVFTVSGCFRWHCDTVEEQYCHYFRDEWSFQFNRGLTQEEEQDLVILLAIVGPTNRLNAAEDQRVWTAHGSSFSVKSCYEALTNTGAHPYPYKFIWNNRVPTKVGFFLWTAEADKCLTIANLQKRGHHLTNICYFCKVSPESISHILFHCPFSWNVWAAFIPSFWFWAMPRDLKTLAYCWIGLSSWSERAQYLWSILPMAICWSLWLERNARLYRGKDATIIGVCNSIRGFLLAWCKLSDECTDFTFQSLVNQWDDIFVVI